MRLASRAYDDAMVSKSEEQNESPVVVHSKC